MTVGSVLRTVATGLTHPNGVAWDGYTFWVYDDADHTLHQFDPLTATDLRSFVFAGTLNGDVTFAHGVLIAATFLYAGIGFLDPYDGTLLRKLALTGLFPYGIAWDGDNLWYYSVGAGTINQINPYDGTVLRSFARPGSAVTGLAWDRGTLWVSDSTDNKIYQVSPYDGSILRTVAAPDTGVGGGVVVENTLWVPDVGSANIYQLALN